MEVRVVRSAKRRKTAQARVVNGVLVVRIPAAASAAEERRLVAHFERRFHPERDPLDLTERAKTLAKRFDLPQPRSIRWVSNQRHRWGSCTPSTGEIRLSDRMVGFPTWVVDHVVVHELAHLVEAGHGPRFQALIARNPLAERAEGFLLAKSHGTDPDLDPLGDDLDDLDHLHDDDEAARADDVDGSLPFPTPDDVIGDAPGTSESTVGDLVGRAGPVQPA